MSGPFENEAGALAYQGNMMDAKTISSPTVKQRISMAVADAEQRLKDAQRAKEILDKNPELEELLNIMQKGRF